METLTIFTPTYNRAKFLPRAFEALKRQTLKDFLWMIIDDGSTDNTEEVVQDLLKDTEAGFKIEYVKKENGGLHTGYNKAVAPMKSFEGEKNFNPHYMHLEISKKYDFLVLNENLKYVDYQPGGMSNSMLKQYYNSPNSFAETRKLYLSFDNTSFKFKLKHSIHYVSSCILAGRWMDAIKEAPRKGYVVLAFPFGIILSLIIRGKN